MTSELGVASELGVTSELGVASALGVFAPSLDVVRPTLSPVGVSKFPRSVDLLELFNEFITVTFCLAFTFTGSPLGSVYDSV